VGALALSRKPETAQMQLTRELVYECTLYIMFRTNPGTWELGVEPPEQLWCVPGSEHY